MKVSKNLIPTTSSSVRFNNFLPHPYAETACFPWPKFAMAYEKLFRFIFLFALHLPSPFGLPPNVNSFCWRFLLCKSQNDDGSICFPFSVAQNVDILISHKGESRERASELQWSFMHRAMFERRVRQRDVWDGEVSSGVHQRIVAAVKRFIIFWCLCTFSLLSAVPVCHLQAALCESFFFPRRSERKNHLSWAINLFCFASSTFFFNSDSLFSRQERVGTWREVATRTCRSRERHESLRIQLTWQEVLCVNNHQIEDGNRKFNREVCKVLWCEWVR